MPVTAIALFVTSLGGEKESDLSLFIKHAMTKCPLGRIHLVTNIVPSRVDVMRIILGRKSEPSGNNAVSFARARCRYHYSKNPTRLLANTMHLLRTRNKVLLYVGGHAKRSQRGTVLLVDDKSIPAHLLTLTVMHRSSPTRAYIDTCHAEGLLSTRWVYDSRGIRARNSPLARSSVLVHASSTEQDVSYSGARGSDFTIYMFETPGERCPVCSVKPKRFLRMSVGSGSKSELKEFIHANLCSDHRALEVEQHRALEVEQHRALEVERPPGD